MKETSIQSVAIIGAGTMGHGLAIVHGNAGFDVSLYDIDEEALDRACLNIDSGIETLLESGYITADDRDRISEAISTTTSLEQAATDADLIIETAPEQIEVKKDVFSKLDEFVSTNTILATNTSGLDITELASQVQHPERVLGTHWFNPPYIVPLVELIKTEYTDEALIDELYELYEEIGKTPVVVNKDIPGFIANRLQLAMDYEAWSLLSRGIASAEDIDRAVKAGFGFRIPAVGVFEKADYAGLDIFYDIEEYLMSELDRGSEPNEKLKELVESGDLGLKSGVGVYDWSEIAQEEALEHRDRQLISILEMYEELGDIERSV